MSILNSSIKVNNLTLSNRLVMPPMATEKSGSSGFVTDKLCKYYADKSNSGYIGLIITEHSYVSPEGKASKGQLSIANDDAIPGLKTLVDTIHQNRTMAFAQISHAGGASQKEITGYTPISASSIEFPHRKGVTPQEMSNSDINKIIQQFANAAVRAKKAGFDGVEIHSAHGYLLNQFYSPLTNHRKDEYTGATIEGRTRLHLEIIHAVRDAVGNDYAISLRLGACDYMNNGSTIADSEIASSLFEKAGIDMLSISGGFCGYINPNSKEQGYFSDITSAIKANCTIPILLTGGITTADAAENLLFQKKADLIGVGRAILKDSKWSENAIKSLS